VPILPFWLANALPAVASDASLQEYAIGTVLGIVPGCYVQTQAGEILSRVLDVQPNGVGSLATFLASAALSRDMLAPLVLHAVWAAATGFLLWRERGRGAARLADENDGRAPVANSPLVSAALSGSLPRRVRSISLTEALVQARPRVKSM
jgi:hypothetical protein